jgi:hypothetical protein
MNIAYKLLLTGGKDLLVVFDTVGSMQGLNCMPLAYVSERGQPYFRIGDDLYVPLDKDVMEYLKGAKKILLGESGIDEIKIRFVGQVSVDPLSVGKLLAYWEMGNA